VRGAMPFVATHGVVVRKVGLRRGGDTCCRGLSRGVAAMRRGPDMGQSKSVGLRCRLRACAGWSVGVRTLRRPH
jgi:hypothetical protein